MFVCCECCVLSGKGLCDELITRLEESYRLRCAVVCDIETSCMMRPWPIGGLSRQKHTYKIDFDGLYLIIFFMCFNSRIWLFTKAETCSQQHN